MSYKYMIEKLLKGIHDEKFLKRIYIILNYYLCCQNGTNDV